MSRHGHSRLPGQWPWSERGGRGGHCQWSRDDLIPSQFTNRKREGLSKVKYHPLGYWRRAGILPRWRSLRGLVSPSRVVTRASPRTCQSVHRNRLASRWRAVSVRETSRWTLSPIYLFPPFSPPSLSLRARVENYYFLISSGKQGWLRVSHRTVSMLLAWNFFLV